MDWFDLILVTVGCTLFGSVVFAAYMLGGLGVALGSMASGLAGFIVASRRS